MVLLCSSPFFGVRVRWGEKNVVVGKKRQVTDCGVSIRERSEVDFLVCWLVVVGWLVCV